MELIAIKLSEKNLLFHFIHVGLICQQTLHYEPCFKQIMICKWFKNTQLTQIRFF